jgi:predicted NBD/HSP70 family sugar kinase
MAGFLRRNVAKSKNANSHLLTSLLDVSPKTVAPLDPGFVPAVLANRSYRAVVEKAGAKVKVAIAIEREDGHICRGDIDVLAPGSAHDSDTLRFVERHIKFLLWSRGGWKIYFSGPEPIGRCLKKAYAEQGERGPDVEIMQRAYDKTFAFENVNAGAMPAENEVALAIGGHLDGCRIGFDLGASDYKVAAVIDGKPVYCDEFPWNPRDQPDPQYHIDHIRSGLKKAAQHLPRVQAVGGSSAGVLVNNKLMVASLFRGVAKDKFEAQVKPMFLNMEKEWGVPFTVINDGEVTALAGAISLGTKGMLGVAMGSSEAAGYLDRRGKFRGWLDELAFAPVDFNPAAAKDEWSGDAGVGAIYFSQQAVNRLIPAAGLSYPKEMDLPERLKEVQTLAERGDGQARRIFETIGVYLGYTIPYYAEYYDFSHLLILGRVISGAGGDIILAKARAILKKEFPELTRTVGVHVPDEKSRRVGQAVAAASLPELN